MNKIRKIDLKKQIVDRVNCSCVFKIENDEKEISIGDKIYSRKDVKVLIDNNFEEVFIYTDKDELISKLSYELYKSAKEMIELWYGEIEEVWIAGKGDLIIFVTKPMAIAIAPRVENE